MVQGLRRFRRELGVEIGVMRRTPARRELGFGPVLGHVLPGCFGAGFSECICRFGGWLLLVRQLFFWRGLVGLRGLNSFV
jgi:hypothetical protein